MSSVPILVVDDQPGNLLVLEGLLSGMDLPLKVVSADSGNRALRLSLQDCYALVLLDVQMPGMDGYEVAELLRANPKTRALPIIFVTAGMNAAPQVFRGYESGAVDYLSKPLDRQQLFSKVRVFSELYMQRRRLECSEQALELQVRQRTAALRQSEAQLLTLNAELEARVQARTAELRQAITRIAEAERLAGLGRLVAGVGHEMNTPIGNVMLAATTQGAELKAMALSLEGERVSRSELRQQVARCLAASELIESGSVRAAELVRKFKELAVDLGFQQRSNFVFLRAVQAGLNPHQAALRSAGIVPELTIDAGLRLHGHPAAVLQIVDQLVRNSLRHAFAEQAAPKIEIRAELIPGALLMSYRDNGCGVPAADLPHVFEPFFTTCLGQGGSGLGLSLVYNLIHMVLQGQIEAQSPPGQGFCLRIQCPVGEDQGFSLDACAAGS